MRKLGIHLLGWTLVLLSGLAGAAAGFILTGIIVFMLARLVYGAAEADEWAPGIGAFMLIGGFIAATFMGFVAAAVAAKWVSRE